MSFEKVKDKTLFILITIILALVFVTMFYMDLSTTIQLSYVWFKSAFDGKYASFYSNALLANVVHEGAVYDVGIYAILGIWGIPIWILNKIMDISVISVGSFLWFKLLLVLCLAMSIKSTNNITRKLCVYDSNTTIHMLSMMIFVVPVIAVAQYDIIPLLLAIMAIENGLDEVNYKSIFLFAASLTMKPFTIFVFVIYLLIKEKTILNIIKYGVIGILPLLLCKFVYLFNKNNAATNNSFLNSKFQKLMDVTITDGHGEISLFVLALILVCVGAYCYRDKKTDNKMFFLFETIIWLAFCIMTPSYPYWVVYLCPFLIVSLGCITGENSVIANILELLIELSLFLVLTISYPWVFGGSYTMSYLILKGIYSSKTSVTSVYDYICRFGINRFEPVVHAILMGASIGFVLLVYKSIVKEDHKSAINYTFFNYIRIFVLCVWFFLCVALLFVAA